MLDDHSFQERSNYLTTYQQCMGLWYGANINTTKKLLNHLEKFSNITYHKDGNLLDESSSRSILISGPIDQVEKALYATIKKNQDFFSYDITLNNNPFSIAGIVAYHTLKTPHEEWPANTRKQCRKNQMCQRPTLNTVYPIELSNIYDFPNPEKPGHQQHIAILQLHVERDSDSYKKELIQYINDQIDLFAPNTNKVVQLNIQSKHILSNTTEQSTDLESSLDQSIITSLAPHAKITLSSSNLGVFFNYDHAIHSIQPDIISSSLISFDTNPKVQILFDELMIDAAMRNITVIVASGDQGSANNRQNNTGITETFYSSSSSWQLSVGGSSWPKKLSENPSKSLYQKSDITTWNQVMWDNDAQRPSLDPRSHNMATSGGITKQAKPSYQKHLNYDHRAYPDVSFLAGGLTEYGAFNSAKNEEDRMYGTSASAPMMASLVALINQSLSESNTIKLGFINPLIYQAYNHQPSIFKDVTLGDNCNLYDINTMTSPCYTDPSYKAKEGFDLATGLGDPNGTRLLEYLKGHFNDLGL